MAGKKINDLTALGRDLASTDLLELSLAGGTGSRKITGQQILNSAKSGLVPTTRTLTINGTTQDLSADRTFTVSTGITIGTTAITLGTVGRVLFEGTGNVVQESANLFWDNTNGRLGIGTSTPESQNHILSNNSNVIQLLETNNGVTTSLTGLLSLKTSFATTPSNNAGPAILFQLKVGATTNSLGYINTVRWNNNAGGLMQLATNANGVIEPKLNIFPNGNVLIQLGGATTDAGYKLDVNGTARVSALYVPRDPSYGTRTFLYNADGVDLMQTVSNDQLRITRSTYFSSWISVGEIQTGGQLNLSSSINISGANIGGIIRNTATWGLQANATVCGIYFAPTIDTDASSSSETIKGFYYNPNIADLQSAKHWAIHTTSGRVRFEGLPTSPTGLNAGDLWNNSGVLSIV